MPVSLIHLLCLLLAARIVQSFVPQAVPGLNHRRVDFRRARSTSLWTTSGNADENDKNNLDDGNDNDNDNDLPNFYDDFAELDTSLASFLAPRQGEEEGDSSNVTPSSSVLQERIQQVQQAEAQDQDRVRNNWDQANWQVRGFSLDTVDAKQERVPGDAATPTGRSFSPIHVTTLTAPTTNNNMEEDGDDDEQGVWVGRTDGSLIFVRLGSEYVARFESKLSLEPSSSSSDDNLSVSLQSKLVRDDSASSDDDDDDDDDDRQRRMASEDPFEILCQCQAHDNQPVQHVVAHGPHVYTVAKGSSDIQPWLIPEPTSSSGDTNGDTFGLVAQPALTGVHQAPLVGLHAVSMVPTGPSADSAAEPMLLTSVSEDGILAVWDMSTGTLLFTCHLMMNDEDEQDAVITSATAAHGHWFLGLSDGTIIGYPMATLVEASADGGPCPLPAVEWTANSLQTAITALHVWGPATVRGTSSLVVVSGDADGLVQQWDLLERRSDSSAGTDVLFYDAWPKMARQRLSERAHLLQGHEGAITCITSTPHAVVSSSRDGTVRAFDPSTGDVTTRMDGFIEDQLANLCLVGRQDLLLTDGSGPHVTVHDFFAASEDILKDVDLEWDE